ncbi:hypothetical protein DFH09DRAFT_1043845, partial [Mycena vulgaris]
MAAAVWETVEKFGLIGRVRASSCSNFQLLNSLYSKITAFVMDNATNNDTLVEAFARRCRALRIPFSSSDGRMRCMPHTIHLAALKLLEAIGALTKEEKQKAKSRTTVYQDPATESLSCEQDDQATQHEDVDDSDTVRPTSTIGSAVFKLRKSVRHVRSSPQRRKTWQKEVRDCVNAAPGAIDAVLMLILDVKT